MGASRRAFNYKIKTIQGNGRSLSALALENPATGLRIRN
jgi:hypothetical protein